jgi:hypothetical protein
MVYIWLSVRSTVPYAMRSFKTMIYFLKRRSEKSVFLISDKKIMAINAPKEAKLKAVFVDKRGKKITYPIHEMINSWMEIEGYQYFYVSRPRIGFSCEVEFAVS